MLTNQSLGQPKTIYETYLSLNLQIQAFKTLYDENAYKINDILPGITQ